MKVKSLSRVRLFVTSLCSLPGSSDSFEKTLMLGRIEGGRRRGRQRMRRLDGITASMNMSLNKTPGVGDGQGCLECCSPWGCKESDKTKRLSWTELRLLGPWGLSSQEYWSGLPFLSPGDFPNPGIEPGSWALHADSTVWVPNIKHIILNIGLF